MVLTLQVLWQMFCVSLVLLHLLHAVAINALLYVSFKYLESSNYALCHFIIFSNLTLFPQYCYQICFSEFKTTFIFNVINSSKCSSLLYIKQLHYFPIYIGRMLTIPQYELAPNITILVEQFTLWQQEFITGITATTKWTTMSPFCGYVLTLIIQQTFQNMWRVCSDI